MDWSLLILLICSGLADAALEAAFTVRAENLMPAYGTAVRRYDIREATKLPRYKYGRQLVTRQGCPNEGDMACGPNLCCDVLQNLICWGSTTADFQCCSPNGCTNVNEQCPESYFQCEDAPAGTCCPLDSSCYFPGDGSVLCSSLTTSSTTPDYITTTPDYITTTPDYITTTPDYITTTPDYITTTPDYISSSTTTSISDNSDSYSSSSSSSSSTNSIWTPAMIGGIAGGVGGMIILIIALIVVCVHRRRKRRDKKEAWMRDAPPPYIPTYEDEKAREQRAAQAEILRQKYAVLKAMHNRLAARKSRGSSSTAEKILTWGAKKALWYGVKHLVIYPTLHAGALALTGGFGNVIVAGHQAQDVLSMADASDVVDAIGSSDLSDADVLNNFTDIVFPDGLDGLPDYCDLTPGDADTLGQDMNSLYAAFRDLNIQNISTSNEYDSLFNYNC